MSARDLHSPSHPEESSNTHAPVRTCCRAYAPPHRAHVWTKSHRRCGRRHLAPRDPVGRLESVGSTFSAAHTAHTARAGLSVVCTTASKPTPRPRQSGHHTCNHVLVVDVGCTEVPGFVADVVRAVNWHARRGAVGPVYVTLSVTEHLGPVRAEAAARACRAKAWALQVACGGARTASTEHATPRRGLPWVR